MFLIYGYKLALLVLLAAAGLDVTRKTRSPIWWIKLAAILLAVATALGSDVAAKVGVTPLRNGSIKMGPYWLANQYGHVIGLLTYATAALVDGLMERARTRST